MSFILQEHKDRDEWQIQGTFVIAFNTWLTYTGLLYMLSYI